MEPSTVDRALPQIINGEFKPRILEYPNELKSMRDQMFGELIKNGGQLERPFDFLGGTWPGLAFRARWHCSQERSLRRFLPVVDYYVVCCGLQRRNSAADLVGTHPQVKIERYPPPAAPRRRNAGQGHDCLAA